MQRFQISLTGYLVLLTVTPPLLWGWWLFFIDPGPARVWMRAAVCTYMLGQ